MTSAQIMYWDLDSLPAELLEAVYGRMADFAGWLRDAGVQVPACWYYHRWAVHQFAAVMHWRERAYAKDEPRLAAEWWASSWGLAGMQAAWSRLGCPKGGKHLVAGKEVPTPLMEEVVREHVEYVRSHRRSSAS